MNIRENSHCDIWANKKWKSWIRWMVFLSLQVVTFGQMNIMKWNILKPTVCWGWMNRYRLMLTVVVVVHSNVKSSRQSKWDFEVLKIKACLCPDLRVMSGWWRGAVGCIDAGTSYYTIAYHRCRDTILIFYIVQSILDWSLLAIPHTDTEYYIIPIDLTHDLLYSSLYHFTIW